MFSQRKVSLQTGASGPSVLPSVERELSPELASVSPRRREELSLSPVLDLFLKSG